MKSTKVSLILIYQTKQDKWVSNFMKNCDFWDISAIRKQPISFTTTTKVDEEYIENFKKNLIWKECDDMISQGVENFSIEF